MASVAVKICGDVHLALQIEMSEALMIDGQSVRAAQAAASQCEHGDRESHDYLMSINDYGTSVDQAMREKFGKR